jgi:uncharacterized protein YceK
MRGGSVTRYGILAVAVACAAYVFLCGCGTARNLQEDEPKIYGGVRVDVEACTNAVTASISQRPVNDSPAPAPGLAPNVVEGMARLADLPLSLIADTFSLPFTLTAEIKRIVEPRAKAAK